MNNNFFYTNGGAVIWISGLSGSGKTTICKSIWRKLKKETPELVIIDGDEARKLFENGILREKIGHDERAREGQVARLRALSKYLADQGFIVIVAAVYTNRDIIEENRKTLPRYFQVILNETIETVTSRDTKGLYFKAKNQPFCNIVGVDIPWNLPDNADLILKTSDNSTPDELADQIINTIVKNCNLNKYD